MRIAMMGTRGVPATYGGIEHHVEEIGSRLVERGHEVTVYCRDNYIDLDRPSTSYRGMDLRVMRTAGTKHLDAIVHTALATTDAMRRGFDVLHYHAVGPATLALLPRLGSRKGVVATVHGLDSQRDKWGTRARTALRGAEWLVGRAPHQTVVVSQSLRDHFRDTYDRDTVYIQNGVVPGRSEATKVFGELGIRPGRYLLFVGRLVPEKAPDLLIKAFRQVETDAHLVLAGGSSFTNGYVADVRALAAQDPRVVLPGYVYGRDLQALYTHATAFVLPSRLEGLPLTLLEAASYGLPLVASNIPPHVEVLTSSGPGHRMFPVDQVDALAATLREVLADPVTERAAARDVRKDVLRRYAWDAAVDRLEMVYAESLAQRASRLMSVPWRRREEPAPAPASVVVDLTSRPRKDDRQSNDNSDRLKAL
jgi:glycosyltransferase involved in cell wall biosynthesis